MKTCPNCGEILGDSVKVCFKCNYNYDFKKVLDKNELKEQQQLAEELAKVRGVERENQLEKNPKFEYLSVVINDLPDGTINNNLIQNTLTQFAEDGWRLHSIFTNEIGKTSSSVAIGFLGTTVNATIDQTILVFERCVKAEEK